MLLILYSSFRYLLIVDVDHLLDKESYVDEGILVSFIILVRYLPVFLSSVVPIIRHNSQVFLSSSLVQL